MANSAWSNLYLIYYVGKCFGLFPFAGNHKILSFFYSLVLWIVYGHSCLLSIFSLHEFVNNKLPTQRLLKWVMLFEKYFVSIVSVLNMVLSAFRSKRFFKILDSFYRFDKFTLQMRFQTNHKSQQFYLLFILFVWTYNVYVVNFYKDIKFFIFFIWSLFCVLTMIATSQYIICIKMLSDRYKLANILFEKSISRQTTTDKFLYPTEVQNVFIKLRNLTEEVNTFYGSHALIIIIDLVIIAATFVTKITFNHISNNKKMIELDNLIFVYNIYKFIFIFFLVREAHITIKESKKTVMIAHDVLCTSTNTWIIKEYEAFILNCWSNPIIFDVCGILDLDYKLLQTIIASIVTYIVVLYQVRLAISNQ